MLQENYQIINVFGKLAGYKINKQKPVAFIYTNKRSDREIKEAITSTITSKIIKCLRINLPKEVKTCILKTIRH